MFQLGKHKEAKGRKGEIQRSQESRGKEKTDTGEGGGERKKRLADEAMINIACGDIVTNTTEAVLSGGGPLS